jgi:hypothetical protein
MFVIRVGRKFGVEDLIGVNGVVPVIDEGSGDQEIPS